MGTRIGDLDLGLGNGNWDGGWRIEIGDWDCRLVFEIEIRDWVWGLKFEIEKGIQIEYYL